MSRADWARLLILAAIWGGSFIFMRLIAPALGPVVTADARLLIAGSAVLGWFLVTGFQFELRRWWKQYLIGGAINSAVPFVLFAYAATHIPASYSAIFNSTAPFWGAICGALWLGETLTATRISGLVIGLGGVVVVSRAGTFTPDADFILASLACILAAVCYGLGGVYLKKFCSGIPPQALAGATQWMAGLLLLPLVPFSPPQGPLTWFIVANLLGLALLCSALAYSIYYRLLGDIGPSKALTVTFLIPVFGLLWSAIFLGEQITVGMLGGCALVLVGTYLVTRTARPAPVAAVAKAR